MLYAGALGSVYRPRWYIIAIGGSRHGSLLFLFYLLHVAQRAGKHDWWADYWFGDFRSSALRKPTPCRLSRAEAPSAAVKRWIALHWTSPTIQPVSPLVFSYRTTSKLYIHPVWKAAFVYTFIDWVGWEDWSGVTVLVAVITIVDERQKLLSARSEHGQTSE